MSDQRSKYFNDDQIAEMDAGFPTRRHMAESAPLPRSEGAAPTTPKIKIRAESGNVAMQGEDSREETTNGHR